MTRGGAVRHGPEAIVDGEMGDTGDPHLGQGPDPGAGQEPERKGVSLHRDGRDGGAERRGLPRLLLVGGGIDLVVEVARIDSDAGDAPDPPVDQPLGQGEQVGAGQGRVAAPPQGQKTHVPPIADGALKRRPHPEGRAQDAQRRRGGDELLVRRGVQGEGLPAPEELDVPVDVDDVDPDPVGEAGAPQDAGELVGEGAVSRSPGGGARRRCGLGLRPRPGAPSSPEKASDVRDEEDGDPSADASDQDE